MSNKYSIVTGASRGLGAAIAEELAREGYDVVITYCTQADKAQKVKKQLETKFGVRVESYQLDIKDEEAVLAFRKWVEETLGTNLQVLVNNAGIYANMPAEEIASKTFCDIIDVNVKGTFFMADTLINRHPSAEVLIDIARLTHDAVKFFAHEPVMAMLSYSNFGSDKQGSPLKVHEAIDFLHKTYPDMVVDGEMQVNFALDKKLRDDMYPFNKLKGQDVNTLIFPNLSSANSAYKLLDTLGITETIGPIQMGLNKPIHFTDVESSTRDIVNLTTVAVVDAIVQEQIEKENR